MLILQSFLRLTFKPEQQILEYILNFVEAFSGLTGMTEGQLLDWVRLGSGIINIGIIQYNEIHK